MDFISILGGLVIALIILAGLRYYYEYRSDLNKEERKARLEKRDFKKPSMAKDAKNGFAWLVIIIISAFAFLVLYNILHFLFPYWFPDGGYR